jgi:hypothetical protein
MSTAVVLVSCLLYHPTTTARASHELIMYNNSVRGWLLADGLLKGSWVIWGSRMIRDFRLLTDGLMKGSWVIWGSRMIRDFRLLTDGLLKGSWVIWGSRMIRDFRLLTDGLMKDFWVIWGFRMIRKLTRMVCRYRWMDLIRIGIVWWRCRLDIPSVYRVYDYLLLNIDSPHFLDSVLYFTM